MKTIKKKIIPMLLAFLVAITSILPSILSPTKAYAKNHDLGIRRVDKWNFHSDSMKKDIRSEIFYIDGEWAFCIQPGIAFNEGTGREVSAESVGISETQAKKLALIVWYGYRSQDEDEFDYFFTQSAIWRYLGSKQVHFRAGKKKEDLAKFDDWYKRIMKKVNDFHDLPSFNGKTIKAKQGETTSIKDSNGVVSGLRIKNVTGGTAIINGNTLKVTPNGSKDKMEIKFDRGMTLQQTRTQFVVKKGNDQAVSYLTGRDPYKANVTIEVDQTGGVKLNKTVEFLKEADHRNYTQGSWKSIVFELYSEELGKIGEYKLGDFEDGNIKIENLAIGKYYFLEKNQPKGYIENKVKIPFEIKEGENKKILGANLKVENNLTRISFVKKDNDGNIIKGAKLKIENAKGETIHTFISKESPYIIEGLEQGEYTLTEEEAPKGFVRSKEKVKFRVTNDEKLVEIVLTNKTYSILKKDNKGKILAGAEFEILDKEGKVIDTFKTDNEWYNTSNLVAGETYTLRELKAPIGYTLMRDLMFKVDEAMPGEVLTAINKIVEITKEDGKEKPVKGAEFEIINKRTGKVVDTFTSTKQAHKANNLREEETYILREVKAPDGYVKMLDTEFTVTTDKENQEIKAVNKQVKILKENDKGEPVEGAEFDIIDKETGDKVDSFTSSKEGYNPNNLVEGKTYILKEVKAPKGYSLMEDIEFTVTKDKELQTVTAVDKQITIKKVDSEGKALEGATFDIIDKEKDKVVDSFTSTKDGYNPSNLVEGKTYILRETKAPEGYSLMEDIEFTVEPKKENQEVTAVDKQITIKKVDSEGKALEGAEFDIIDKDKDEKVDSFTSTKDGYNPSNLVEGKTYILRETKAPEGYSLMEDIEFTVEPKKENQEVTAVDKQITIKKVDADGKPVEGAEFEILDKDKKVIDTFTSQKEPHKVNGLKEGESYTLHEIKAPAGYVLMKDVEFSVSKDKENQEITAVNKQVGIKKVTQEGKPLKGAKMQILRAKAIKEDKKEKDKKEEVVEEFTTTDEVYLAANVVEGEEYILREMIAPEGYEKAEDIKFKVESGKNQVITMVDKDKKGIPVKTGDDKKSRAGSMVAFITALYVYRKLKSA